VSRVQDPLNPGSSLSLASISVVPGPDVPTSYNPDGSVATFSRTVGVVTIAATSQGQSGAATVTVTPEGTDGPRPEASPLHSRAVVRLRPSRP